jgi:hypothetical protein
MSPHEYMAKMEVIYVSVKIHKIQVIMFSMSIDYIYIYCILCVVIKNVSNSMNIYEISKVKIDGLPSYKFSNIPTIKNRLDDFVFVSV